MARLAFKDEVDPIEPRGQGASGVGEYHEFPGRTHFTLEQPGWEEVADFALDWASEHARATGATA